MKAFFLFVFFIVLVSIFKRDTRARIVQWISLPEGNGFRLDKTSHWKCNELQTDLAWTVIWEFYTCQLIPVQRMTTPRVFTEVPLAWKLKKINKIKFKRSHQRARSPRGLWLFAFRGKTTLFFEEIIFGKITLPLQHSKKEPPKGVGSRPSGGETVTFSEAGWRFQARLVSTHETQRNMPEECWRKDKTFVRKNILFFFFFLPYELINPEEKLKTIWHPSETLTNLNKTSIWPFSRLHWPTWLQTWGHVDVHTISMSSKDWRPLFWTNLKLLWSCLMNEQRDRLSCVKHSWRHRCFHFYQRQ